MGCSKIILLLHSQIGLFISYLCADSLHKAHCDCFHMLNWYGLGLLEQSGCHFKFFGRISAFTTQVINFSCSLAKTQLALEDTKTKSASTLLAAEDEITWLKTA